MSDIHHGSCCCGAVRFHIEGPLWPVIGCHCRECRKLSGSYVMMTSCERAKIHFETEEGLVWYRSSDTAERGFCGKCGSNLFYRLFDPENQSIEVAGGAFDDPSGLSMSHHIFIKERGHYYELDDDLPQFSQDSA